MLTVDVLGAVEAARDGVDLPADGNEYALLGVASIQSSPRPRAARAWIEFLLSDTAAAIYERHGFTAVPRESRMQAIRLP